MQAIYIYASRNRRFNILWVFIFLLFSTQSAFAQQATVEGFKTNVSPKSPEAAALFKFIDVPVSEHTGIPSINVPISSISSGSLSVNVSLSYHASGNKVAEIPNWVGLGWKLNAGGMISRKVHGLPDEANVGLGFIDFRKQYTYSQVDRAVNSARSIRDEPLWCRRRS